MAKKVTSFNKAIQECPMAAGPFTKKKRRCDWCGKKLGPKKRRWCSEDCSRAAVSNHVYSVARKVALRRSRWTCVAVGCGARRNLQVNHIDPCRGRHAISHCIHHQTNLEVLCSDCHKRETARQRASGEI